MNISTIQIPGLSRCLIVEDNEARHEWFRENLPGCSIAESPQIALEILKINQNWDIIFLDHDCHGRFFVEPTDPEFLNRTFWQVAQHLHRIEFPGQIVIHSGNPVGAKRMEALLGPKCKVAVIPFGMFDIEVIS